MNNEFEFIKGQMEKLRWTITQLTNSSDGSQVMISYIEGVEDKLKEITEELVKKYKEFNG